MTWYWLLLIVIGYLIVGAVFGKLMGYVSWEFEDPEFIGMCIVAWPVVIPTAFLYELIMLILE